MDNPEQVTVYGMNPHTGHIQRREGVLYALFPPSEAGPGRVQFRSPKTRDIEDWSFSAERAYLLVLRGWGHPAPDDLMVPSYDGKSRRSRYPARDPRYVADFERRIRDYLGRHPEAIMLDCRASESRASA